jgi:ADP-ribose pyrophosphatase
LVLVTRENSVESKRLFDGYIISLRQDKLKLPDDTIVTREIVEHNGGVVIACQPQPDQIILIRQYRYPIDKEILELPAGRIEVGEDPLICAKRELTEETGFKAQGWQEMARFYSAPGFCNELLYLYKASSIEFEGKRLDIDEETEVLVFPLEEAWSLCLSGKIQDAKTIAGLALLRNS